MGIKQDRHKPFIFGNCKKILTTVFMFYFSTYLVFGAEEEESEFCRRRWCELVEDRKLWETECLNNSDVRTTLCCQTTAEYLEKRYDTYTKWCPIVEGRCTCYYIEREKNLFVEDGRPISLSWHKPTFSCQHKHIFKKYRAIKQSLENKNKDENITSPHYFYVGSYHIKNIFELYGGMELTCTIVVNIRTCTNAIQTERRIDSHAGTEKSSAERLVDVSSESIWDMWILWDNSWSIGAGQFRDYVKPFMKNLIKSPQVEAGPHGTHIGILTFSTQEQTRVLLDIGEKQTIDELVKYIDDLQYEHISGDGTRTGMALKIADEKFSLRSPRNYRPNADDVVLIFTDGKPIRRRGEDTFGDKYKSNYDGEIHLANDRARSLRDKNVTIIGLAAGKKSALKEFRNLIKAWSTKDKYFETHEDKMQKILNGIKTVVYSFSVPEDLCTCYNVLTVAYAARGKTALIHWEKPRMECPNRANPEFESTVVIPDVSPPAHFPVGTHNITYTFNFKSGITRTCSVAIFIMNKDCAIDMWILLDNSLSGELLFQQKVKMLQHLITNQELNVRPNGTHIGILTFSAQKQTRVLLEIGEKQTRHELIKYFGSLRYNRASGNGRRTGMALKIIDEKKIRRKSPNNYRRDASDVVLIITDGKPFRPPKEDSFGNKYKSVSNGELLLANDRAKSLRDKDVIVVGLAVEAQSELREFASDVKDWATEEKYFEAKINNLPLIIDDAISAACSDAIRCKCARTETETTAYGVYGQKSKIYWKEPCLLCSRKTYVNEQVSPSRSPTALNVGKHDITYTFTYRKYEKVKSVHGQTKCHSIVDVKECVCSKDLGITLLKQPKSNMTLVTWNDPGPNCTGELTSVIPQNATDRQELFPIGNHSVVYNYNIKNSRSSFNMSCYVNVTIDL